MPESGARATRGPRSAEIPGPVTAFVSHSDCARHDTGWNHPDHQGRLPALMRAIDRDMLTLHDRVLVSEGRHADEAELTLVHEPEYLLRVRGWVEQAALRGSPVEVAPGVVLSGASWDAARAAVGSVLAGVDAVLEGRVRNAFCASRPTGSGARPDAPGGFGIFNSVAIAARSLVQRGVGPVLVLEWGQERSVLSTLFAGDPAIRVLSISDPAESGAVLAGSSGAPSLPSPFPVIERVAGGSAATPMPDPAFLLLVADFGYAELDPDRSAERVADFHPWTLAVRAWADAHCGGRLVSVLEGGSEARVLGRAALQHLRALSGVGPLE